MLKSVLPIIDEPMHQRLAVLFRERITSGFWSEGKALPSEAELCAAHGVSRGTVRQALATLRNEGLLVGGRGKPPQVARAVPSQPFASFMSFTEWAQSMGKRPGQKTLEIARRGAEEELAGRMGLQPGDQVVQLLRLRSLDGVPTMVERGNFVPDVGNLLFEFDPDSGSIFGFLTSRGKDLARGRHVIDAVAADKVDAGMLGVDVGTALLREQRLTYDQTGRVLECSDDRYLPHLANFVIENTRQSRAAMIRIPLVA